MPSHGHLETSPGEDWDAYSSAFNHEEEWAAPGYYGVHLKDSKIKVELTSTIRSGMGKLTYLGDKAPLFLINTGFNQNTNIMDSYAEVCHDNEVCGWIQTGFFWDGPNEYKVYFTVQFDKPFAEFGIWKGSNIVSNARMGGGKKAGVYLQFNHGETDIQYKIGISYVSIDNARINLTTENPNWNFDDIRQNADMIWESYLNRIIVEGGTDAELGMFYSAMYHAFLHPNVFNDVNGDYIGFDEKLHNTKGEYTHYTNFSGWDAYRIQMPLLAMIIPDVADDFVTSLIKDAEQGGGYPRWSVANDDSGIMVGCPAIPAIASIYAFGTRNFDIRKSLDIAIRCADDPSVRCRKVFVSPDLTWYKALGYIPEDLHRERGSASTTIEYSISDFALSQFTKELGEEDYFRYFLRRSQSWKNLMNEENGYIHPKKRDGEWLDNFNPHSYAWAWPEIGFCEGNSDTWRQSVYK